jgi:hypothetical protein
MSQKIKIVEDKKSYLYDEVKSLVVLISGRYYWKTSEKLTLVNVGNKRHRYYRLLSPLITQDLNGEFILKENAVELETGGVLDKSSKHLFNLDGKYYCLKDICKIRDVPYLKSDSRVVKLHPVVWEDDGGDHYELKSKCVRMQEDAYNEAYGWIPKGIFGSIKAGFNPHFVIAYSSEDNFSEPHVAIRYDCGYLYSPNFDSTIMVHNRDIAWESDMVYVAYGFKNDQNIITNGNVVKSAKAIRRDVLGYISSRGEVFREHPNTGYWCREDFYDIFSERFARDDAANNINSTAKAKKHCESKYSENGEDENQASSVNVSWIRPRGGRIIEDFRDPEVAVSSTAKKLGGMRYTFGVEIETSYGKLTSKQLQDLKLAIVSDGTIRAGEYITAPLHGDRGYYSLKKIVKTISENCLVMDETSLHVHVGGINDKKVWNPSFNRRFSINAILLGAQVEEEMFKIQPKSRDPRRKYCSGIAANYGPSPDGDGVWSRDYSGINFKNWRTLLGEYVFGQKYSKKYHKRKELFRWCDGRYKWLNLVNCNSVGRFTTIEFRSYGGTTSFYKIFNYVLLSMAFVWFVDNRQKRILEGGVTLKEIVKSAFGKRDDISHQLICFIEERKKRFNKKTIV